MRITQGESLRTTPTQSPTLSRRLPAGRSVRARSACACACACSTELGLTARQTGPRDDPSTFEQRSDPPPPPPPPPPEPTSNPTRRHTQAPEPGDLRNIGAETTAESLEGSSEVPQIPPSPPREHPRVAVLTPILKKPRAGSQNQLAKTARVVSPTVERSAGAQPSPRVTSLTFDPAIDARAAASRAGVVAAVIGRSAGEVACPSAAPTLRSQKTEKEPSQKGSKKRTTFTANTGTNRKRPGVVRRKSSQSSSGGTSKVASPRLAPQAQGRAISQSAAFELPRNSLPGKVDPQQFASLGSRLNESSRCHREFAVSAVAHLTPDDGTSERAASRPGVVGG